MSLFNFHVLRDDLIPDPGLPPYYSADFFEKIRKVHLTSHLDVATMSSSDWYHYLIKDNITMHTPEDSIKQYLPSRTELAWPAKDGDNTWRLARLKGLGPEVTTFLWKLLHNPFVLPKRESPGSKEIHLLCVSFVMTSLDQLNSTEIEWTLNHGIRFGILT